MAYAPCGLLRYGLVIAAALPVLTALLVFLAPRLRPTADQLAAATA
jgi:hypothetical protein